MQAVILAAGMGKRLGEYTHDNTKCMLEVNGVRLIDRALECLFKVNVSRVVLVVGYKGQNVKDYVGDNYKGIPVVYVDNPIYDKTNNIYSFYLAKDYLVEEDTILLESDLIYATAVIKKLMKSQDPNVALVDKYESWMDGTVVTLDDHKNIVRFIDKRDFKYDEIKDYYKTVNIYKFSREFLADCYIPFLEAYSKAMGHNAYYEDVLKVILSVHGKSIKALPLNGEVWYEIDDVQDLDIATGMFAPTGDAQYTAIASRFGGYWRYPHVLDYCYLVNPFFPPKRMLNEIKASFESLITQYPSGMKVNSLLASKNFGLKQEYIVVGNGAAELIKALMEELKGPLGNVVPTFEEYPNRVSRKVKFTPETEDFHYTADDIINHFENRTISTLLLINPDNPSGNYLGREDVMRLVEWTKAKGLKFVVDESFVDFATESTTLFDNETLCANPHLFVVKSISKSYGVPGIRLGVLASGDTDTVARLKKDVAIWNINSFGEFFLQIFEKYKSDYAKACVLFKEERTRFYKELSKIDFLTVYPSEANYFLAKVNSNYTSRELAIKLLKKNIFIKDCKSKTKGNYIRLAIRDRKDNDYLLQALRSLQQ